MKILSWNVNGIRSVYKKNFYEWLNGSEADIICLQEIKAGEEQLHRDLFTGQAYELYLNCAMKKGYSGVAVYTKERPLKVDRRIGFERFDNEGRMLRLEYSDFTLFCLYLPHGGRTKENLPYKLDVYKYLLDYLKDVKNDNVILAGDFNIAHEEFDLARPKQNRSNIMFTTEEREQIGSLLSLGFIDSFRKFHAGGEHYTWWPYMANARERNIGWRIDYIFTSTLLTSKLRDAFIMKEVHGSDHCPIGIEFLI